MEIREFVEARIADDEAIARAATQGDWSWIDPGPPSRVKQALVADGRVMVAPVVAEGRPGVTDDPIASAVRAAVCRRSDWLEGLLRALPVGGVLCVHELPVELGDPYTAISRAEAHTLGRDGCAAPVSRTQYGPKPPGADRVDCGASLPIS